MCQEDRVAIRWPGGQASFRTEVADNVASRNNGLMFRPSLPISAAMLFVYEQPVHARFWMKNTLVPLDLLFADAAGKVLHIHPNAVPGDETLIDGGADVQYVLEINAGLAQRLGVVPGAEMRHPKIISASWGCGAE